MAGVWLGSGSTLLRILAIVAAETYISRPPPAGRSKRRISATGAPSLSTNQVLAALRPARLARRMASTSALVTGRSSATLGNLPIESWPSSSVTEHFGRRPPSEVPRPRRYARSAADSVLVSTAHDAARRWPSSIKGGVVRRPSSDARWNHPLSSWMRRAPTRLASSTASRKSSELSGLGSTAGDDA